MVLGDGQVGLIAKERKIVNVGVINGGCSDHQVQIASGQRRQRSKVKTTRNIELYISPLIPVGINGGQQPVEAAMAFNCHQHPARIPTCKTPHIKFSTVEPGQDLVGQLQQSIASTGESDRPGFTQKE